MPVTKIVIAFIDLSFRYVFVAIPAMFLFIPFALADDCFVGTNLEGAAPLLSNTKPVNSMNATSIMQELSAQYGAVRNLPPQATIYPIAHPLGGQETEAPVYLPCNKLGMSSELPFPTLPFREKNNLSSQQVTPPDIITGDHASVYKKMPEVGKYIDMCKEIMKEYIMNIHWYEERHRDFDPNHAMDVFDYFGKCMGKVPEDFSGKYKKSLALILIQYDHKMNTHDIKRGFCTGAFLNDAQTLVTARHCVTSIDHNYVLKSIFVYPYSLKSNTELHYQVPVQEIIYPSPGNNMDIAADIILLKLESPALVNLEILETAAAPQLIPGAQLTKFGIPRSLLKAAYYQNGSKMDFMDWILNNWRNHVVIDRTPICRIASAVRREGRCFITDCHGVQGESGGPLLLHNGSLAGILSGAIRSEKGWENCTTDNEKWYNQIVTLNQKWRKQ